MKVVNLTAAVAASLLAVACAPAEEEEWRTDRNTAVCTKDGKRVDDDYCKQASAGGMNNAFLWMYLAANSRMPYYGDPVRNYGGSYTRNPRAQYTMASAYAPKSTAMTRPAGVAPGKGATVSRGGFGSSASARSTGS